MSKIVQNIQKINTIDGTPDANKPVSLLQQMAIDEKVNLTDFNNFKNEVEALLVSNDLTLEAELLLETVKTKIAEAKAYLASTDFKMTIDYYTTLTVEAQTELTTKRAEARTFLKANGL